MNPSKDATTYWQILNREILSFDGSLRDIWQEEKKALVESIYVAKREALSFLAAERTRILQLSKEEAVREVLRSSNLENKMRAIRSVADNGLLGLR